MAEAVHEPATHGTAASSSEPFDSFSALQRAHLELRRKDERPTGDVIRSFAARAQAAGAVIGGASERKAAQGILDYWSTEIASMPSATASDFIPVMLAPFDTGRAEAMAGQPKIAQTETTERPGEVIRLAATARLWRTSGKQKGYLLFGSAITDAAKYRHLDPDIADLVEASEKAATRWSRIRNAFFTVLILGLAGLSVVLWRLYVAADASRVIAEQKTWLAEEETKNAKQEKKELEEALNEAHNARDKARRNAETADIAQERLDASLAVIRRLQQQGVVSRADLPPDIAAAITVAPGPGPGPSGDPSAGNGYDSEFLRIAIPLPGLAERRRRVDYVNYSVVLDTGRRMAALAVSNFNRDRRIVLPRSPMRFAFDSRLPPSIQPDPNWFDSPQIDQGHLVARQEISWGPEFAGSESEASLKLDRNVNILPNATPQFDTFNRLVWSQLERWLLSEHNPRAARISLFTGPVLGQNDPVVDGAPMPRRFWKMAVSGRPDGTQGLIVDAFLIPQFRDGSDEKIGRILFDPARFRVGVREIERLTGLDFGAAVRDAATTDAIAVAPRPARPDKTVYFQFAGMTREDAVRISDRLKALGWQIPGEERTSLAAGQNEVRYGAEADKPAAEMLTDDLKALGLKGCCVTKRNTEVAAGTVEVWVSR